MSSEPIDVVCKAAPQGVTVEVVETLVNRAYDRAKWWSGLTLILQGTLFIGGVVAIFWPKLTLTYPWVALPLALASAEISSRASKYKGLAETAKRQHEYLAGFAVKPSGGQLADLRQSLQKELSPQMHELLRKGITYSSSESPGSRRVLENLSESAWFSRYLAWRCAVMLGTTFILSLAVSITLLALSATSLAGTEAGVAAAKCMAATLLFLISVGTIRSWMAYAKFSQKAKEIDSEACRLSAGSGPDKFETQRLLAEYQLARASAPLIPTWVWRLYRDSLNKDWELKTSK